MFWNALNAIASTISMIAFVFTALYVRGQLKSLEKDRFLTITNDLFTLFQSDDFLKSQFWILHVLKETTWAEFIDKHRNDYGEIAFHRVGSFYDRIGSLIRLKLVTEDQILRNVGGYAIAVWQKIQPLVVEARRIEHSELFASFEWMLPACHECYVPKLAQGTKVVPFSMEQPVDKIDVRTLARRLEKEAHPPTVLDVRQPSQVEADPRSIPGALLIPADDVEPRVDELPPGRDVVVLCA